VVSSESSRFARFRAPIRKWTWASLKPGRRRPPLASSVVAPGPANARISASDPVARMRSPAMASAVRPGFPGQIRPFRTTIEACPTMLEIVAAYEQIDEPPTAC
jgi:hypothetical protein